jgi:RNA-directed DNA polymerase
MSQLTALKSTTSLSDVAVLLGYKASTLSYILYKLAAPNKYSEFEIPKRYGGTRKIFAPAPELKLVQRRLADLLQNCVAEINEANGFEDKISHGFKRGRSIITNAKGHRNRKFVFNVDLTDFFGSINFGRVRGFFIKDKNFSLQPNVATVLAQIACHNNVLPQGSPCSPVISNLIGHVLDIHLVKLSSNYGCTYSRYADDLTFSTNKPNFPTSIAKQTSEDDNDWVPGIELTRLIKRCGFDMNPLKTRMQYHDSRQEVTGLIVNKKVNIRTEYRRTVRAMVHHLFTKGAFEFVHKVMDAKGAVTVNKLPGAMDQLHGMLGFIDGIDLYNKGLEKKTKNPKEKTSLSTKETMYRRFLFFKEFYAAPAPVIICEGKTDNVYLVHAIRSLAAAYPQLASVKPDGTIKLSVRIYKYSGNSTGRILGINGGTAELSTFMRLYHKEIKRFHAPGGENPVIVLVDNDAGAKEKGKIFNSVKDISGAIVTGAEPFSHVTSNLYLVATPLKPGEVTSMIEDFFDKATKAIPIGSKTFDPCNEFDTDTHYGKHVFAVKVVRANADKIDFTGFNPLLSNIASVIDAHKKKYPAVVLKA